MNPLYPDSESFLLTQQFYMQYSANNFLPEINWQSLFPHNQLTLNQIAALETIYKAAVPIALTTLKRLNIDVFAIPENKPQGLGLFEKLRGQEEKLIEHIAMHTKQLNHSTRHTIWSMLLRGGAVLVFKAWLGKVKTGEDTLDLTRFYELADLLWLQSDPIALAEKLDVDPYSDEEHVFLFYQDKVLLERFNNLATAELFVKLGVYDAGLLCLSDEKLKQHFLGKGIVTQAQLDDLSEALNPLFGDFPTDQEHVVRNYH